MSGATSVDNEPYGKARVIIVGIIVAWVLLVAFSINYGLNQSAAAIAGIHVGDRTRIYRESWVKGSSVKELHEELGGLRSDKNACSLSFGAELEVVGVHESRVLLRKLEMAGAVPEACPRGTLFFASSTWYLGTFHQYDEEFERRQKLRAKEEANQEIVRNLLLAEEAIKK